MFFNANFIEIIYDRCNHLFSLCALFINLKCNENIHQFPIYEFEMYGEDIIPFLDKL